MGHFGRRPIKYAWLGYVFPCLYLNYLGQGALILAEPEAVKNPFFHMAPDFLQIPLVALATLATVIASQAVISGAYSLTSQAIQLGYCPRIQIKFTSEREKGQIYIPNINWLLLFSVVVLVLGFKSSSNLASAYGIAVTLTMMIDTVLAFIVVRTLVGLELGQGGPVPRLLRGGGFRVLLRQCVQDHRRRLVPAGAGPLGVRHVVHLEEGAVACCIRS
jgi:KUP system potassium uptake protein